MDAAADFTDLLLAATDGDGAAVDRLVTVLYGELRGIAHRQLWGEESGHTLNTTALVHEAYLKLAKLDRLEWQNRAHFLAIAAQAMRRVLATYAVQRETQKRGGKLRVVPLEKADLRADERIEELLIVHRALERLEEINQRHSRIVECRFFSGMSIGETAEALGLSPATVKRDWTMARAWLNRELGA